MLHHRSIIPRLSLYSVGFISNRYLMPEISFSGTLLPVTNADNREAKEFECQTA
jgi:hypothetical protein